MNPQTDPFHFSCHHHAGNTLQILSQLYRDQLLCDVTLVVEEHEFPAHRVVLSASSPYFSAMFTNNHKESTQSRVILKDIDAFSLESILNFIYTANLDITESNVQNLLGVASLLQITSVVEASCEFLRVRLEPENCLGIRQFADLHGCLELSEFSWRFALEHFQEIVQSEEFLQTPPSMLLSLIQSKDIAVQSEVDILDAVLLWYGHNSSKRQSDLPGLLQYIKIPLIPTKTLEEKLFKNFPPQHSIHQIMQSQINSAQYGTSDFNPFEPRRSYNQRHLYVIGGETNPGRSTTKTVYEYNPTKDKWRELASMLSARRGVGVGILDGSIYAVGGSDSTDALRLVERYDIKHDSWTRVADLNHKRSSVSAAVVTNVLYAVGGYDGFSSCLSSVEKYDPAQNTWTYVAQMNIPRSMSAVGVVGDLLYIVGGYDGQSDLSSCEMYNPLTDTWTLIESMSSNRCMSGVGVLNGQLYVVGGCDCARSLSTAELYDFNKRTWSPLPEMSEARSGLGIAVVGDKMYALGGYTGNGYCNSIEVFDSVTNQWSTVAEMNVGKRRFGCCS